MQFLPVVQRELLVAARKRSTYLARTATAGLLLLFFAVIFVSTNGKRIGFPGLMLWVLSSMIFLDAMLAGVRYTADSLSEEKREGTLGLLFLTSLKGFDIVAGKVIARGAGAVFNLLAAIPIMALTILAGGVTGEQVAALGITSVVAAFFSLSLGTFVSNRGTSERAVLLRTLFLLVVFSFLPLVVRNFAGWLLTRGSTLLIIPTDSPGENFLQALQALRFVSPFHAFLEAQSGFRPDLAPNLWTLTGMGGFFLAYASWRIQRSFREVESSKPAEAERSVGGTRCRAWPWLNTNPIEWLAFRGRSRYAPVISLSLLFILFGLGSRICLEKGWNWIRFILIFGTLGFHWLYKFIITAETCRQINHDARSGALELLLTTPVSADQIVRAQIVATRRTWLIAGFSLGLMNFLWMTERSFLRDLWILLPVSIGLIAFDSYALAWQAVLNGVRGIRYSAAVFNTFCRVMAVPLAVAVLFIIMGMGSNMNDETLSLFFGTWGLVFAGYDCWIVARARHSLSDLRAVMTNDPSPVRISRIMNPFPASRPSLPRLAADA